VPSDLAQECDARYPDGNDDDGTAVILAQACRLIDGTAATASVEVRLSANEIAALEAPYAPHAVAGFV
jgi:hypothetical protein